MRSAHTATVTSEPSVCLEWEARVSEPGDVDPPALVLTREQCAAMRRENWLGGLSNESVARVALAVLRALGVDPPTDEDFTTAASAEVQRARFEEREDRMNERR